MLPDEITTEKLNWNPRNVEHIARHEVAPNEVEEVCLSRFIFWQSYGGRFMVVGRTLAERTLAVVLEPDDNGMYYVVTARPASRRERRLYREGTDD